MQSPPLPPVASDLHERIRGVLAGAAAPLTLAEIKERLSSGGVKFTDRGKASLADGDLLGVDGVHAHPAGTAKGKTKYWHRPPPPPAEVMLAAVRAKAAALGDDPVADSKLGKPTAKSSTPEKEGYFQEAVQALLQEGLLFRHGAKYGKHPPRDHAAEMLATVRAKAAALGDAPVTAAELGLPPRAKADQKNQFAAAVDALVAEGVLYRHGAKYGKRPPREIQWFETAPHQKNFKAVADAAKKLLAGGVTLDAVVAALRDEFAGPAPWSPPAAPAPVVAPETPPVEPPPALAVDLRAVLKSAYDELVTFAESRDTRLVRLPWLLREAQKTVHELQPREFQEVLWQMGRERLVELHVLNEVRDAVNPELAIDRDGRLYYFVRWVNAS